MGATAAVDQMVGTCNRRRQNKLVALGGLLIGGFAVYMV
jgi:hypothetical protein